MDPLSDEVLVGRCCKGDKRAFGELVDRYQRVMFNVALRVVRNREDAEDVVQSAFVKAYENLGRYDSSYRFFSWLYRIAMNEALNAAERRRIRRQTPEVDLIEQEPGEIERRETSKHLEEALMELPPEDRAIILLKHFEGFSYDEIAFIFEIPSARVKSRLYTARQRLKDVLVSNRYLA